jgi:hypothetical protein
MRFALVLFVFACGPVFCQDNAIPAPNGVGQKLNDNLRQRLDDILDSQGLHGTGIVTQPQLFRLRPPQLMRLTSSATCSIQLLNVSAPGKPVPMPKVGPKPSDLSKPIDRMSIVAPAPACPANFGQMVAPPNAPASRP